MEVVKIAQGLQKERFQEGLKSKLLDTIADCMLYEKYNIQLLRDDEKAIGKYTHLIPKDQKSRSIGVFYYRKNIEIPLDFLCVDVVVFVDGQETFAGWLPVQRIKECEQSYKEIGNFREEVTFVVPPNALMDMPTVFDFNVLCPCDGNSLWDNDNQAWECMICGRIKPSIKDRERITKLNLSLLDKKAARA